MSETTTTQFTTSNEAKQWLENQTNTVLAPVQNQAKERLNTMNLQIQALSDNSKYLFDLSNKEIEKRNMKVYNRARALNRLARVFIDRFKKLPPPDQVSYDNLNRYTQETQKVLIVTDIDLKNWFPRISPYFIMDRRRFQQIYEKAKQAHNELNDFVTKEYVKTKTLEEALIELNELQNTEKHITTLTEDKNNIKNERLTLEQEITDLEQKITALKSAGPIDKLNRINTEIENLSNELKNNLRHLQKPFIKMQALATSGGGGGITPDELKKINQYLESPFEGIETEQQGHPELRSILEKLEGMMTKDTLKLKPEKQRKAEQSVNEILHKDSLTKIQTHAKEMATSRDQLLASAKMDEIKQNITQYQNQLDQLRARKTSVETHETVKANSYNETADKINSLKRTIEKKIYTAMDKKIQIA